MTALHAEGKIRSSAVAKAVNWTLLRSACALVLCNAVVVDFVADPAQRYRTKSTSLHHGNLSRWVRAESMFSRLTRTTCRRILTSPTHQPFLQPIEAPWRNGDHKVCNQNREPSRNPTALEKYSSCAGTVDKAVAEIPQVYQGFPYCFPGGCESPCHLARVLAPDALHCRVLQLRPLGTHPSALSCRPPGFLFKESLLKRRRQSAGIVGVDKTNVVLGGVLQRMSSTRSTGKGVGWQWSAAR